MTSYNRTRHAENLLDKNKSHPPSFAVHLHAEHWMLNNVSKFSYSTPISSLLDDIRAHRIPVDFLDIFDAAKVPFYEGCMIVELLDYRQQALDKPERTRVVLYPNGETLFADICAQNRKLGEKWTDRDALEVEARILVATSQPLCLIPDPHLTRVVNHVMRVSTPTVPNSLKRKAAVMDPEVDEVEKARRLKVMQFMAPRPGRTHAQNYRILDTLQLSRQPRDSKPPTPVAPPPPTDQSVQTPSNVASYPAVKKLNGTGTPKPGFPTGSPHGSANQTPSPTHMFANPPTTAESKRAPTPLQQQYTASPQPPNPQPISQPPQAQLPVQPSNTPRPPSVAAFQPPIPSAQFLSQPPPGRNVVDGQAKTANHPNGAAPTPQFIGNAYQHTYRLPQTPQPQAASPQPHPQANGRATPRPPNGIPPTAQAKALAMATARAGRLPAGSPPNAAAAQHPNAQLGHFSYHSPHLRPAVPPAGTAQLQAAHAAMVAQAARASPSPAPNAQNGGRPNPAAVEGGQPMGQPAQAAAAANFLAYQNMLRANANAAYPGMNWQQQLASMPGRGMPMPAANGHQLQMQMQQAAGMMPGGQHAMPHHPVPVGGGGKGQPGHPGR